jgi:hypothetical protein
MTKINRTRVIKNSKTRVVAREIVTTGPGR